MENQNKVVTEKKEAEKKTITVPGTAICLGAILCFALGDCIATRKVTRGLNAMCKADPTFESHFWSAVGEVYKKRGTK